jgi:hypothetical protein
MQIEKVDMVGAQGLETLFDRNLDVLGAAVEQLVATKNKTDLRGQKNLIAFSSTFEPSEMNNQPTSK